LGLNSSGSDPMANDEHVAILKKGVAAWNAWRDENPNIPPDLTGANLTGADLTYANLSGADLTKANLSMANLSNAFLWGANLAGANLAGANLSGSPRGGVSLSMAILRGANLAGAFLSGANLSGADLIRANLSGADLIRANLGAANLEQANLSEANLGLANLEQTKLSEANLTNAYLWRTVFNGTVLTEVQGLDQCEHAAPSSVDFQTLKNSGPLPIAFLRGVGLPDNLIEYLPSLLNTAIQHYSCFISFSSKDHAFANRLYADLQNHGVRSWFAPHDMPIGAKIIDAIDEAIRLRDKVLLILSEVPSRVTGSRVR
jgi:uncharacterized protein YjbI with pentapeptide repeats